MQSPDGERPLAAGVIDRPIEAGDALWLRVKVMSVLEAGCMVKIAGMTPGLSHYCGARHEDLFR
jgi:hypothetical protein